MDRDDQNSDATWNYSKNSIKAQVKSLLNETLRRYPGQQYEKETLKAWQEDWESIAGEIGITRFTEAVRRARSYSKFFPHPADIREYTPAVKLKDGEAWNRELRELQKRKAAGERFYTLGDVFATVASKIRMGEIKPSNPQWYEWANKFKGKA